MLREGKAVHQPMEIAAPESIIARPTKFFRKTSTSQMGHTALPPPSPPTQEFDRVSIASSNSRPASRRTSTSSGFTQNQQSFQATSSSSMNRPDIRKIRSTSTSSLSVPAEENHTLRKQPSSGSWGASKNLRSPSPSNGYATANKPMITKAPSYTAVAAKKKPPPPPPPKPKFKTNKQNYVVALYDFTGQGEGDLSFREGDHIKIVQRTENTDGKFPSLDIPMRRIIYLQDFRMVGR